ncbi:MAG: outer membrane beta-barrel protein [Bacteroidota bacterium]
MLRAVIVILLACTLSPLIAQDGLISFGFLLSPDRSSPSTFLYSYEEQENFQLIENAKTTASFGVVTQYWLSPWVTLRLGIQYADRGYKQTRLSDDLTQIDITRYRFSYLSFPLTVKCPLNQGPAFVYLSTGIATDWFLHGHGGDFSFFNDQLNDVSMSYLLGLGAEVELNQTFKFAFEPMFRLAVTDYSVNRRYRPFSLGLGLRLLYR